MKKLISCLLAVLLVCSVMSMNVFADTVDVVGTPTNTTPSINDGVNENEFTTGKDAITGADTNIDVNFGQNVAKDPETGEDVIVPGGNGGSTIIHKYAVDITFGDFLLDLTKVQFGEDGSDVGSDVGDSSYESLFMVWDVNEYKYVLCFWDKEESKYVPADIKENAEAQGNTPATEDDVTKDVLTEGITLDSKVTVTNHSDLSVTTTLKLVENYADIDWTITAGAEKVGAMEHTEVIGRAVADTDDEDGHETCGSTYSFTATPATTVSDGWLGVIGNMLNNPVTTIGNITITVAPTANA